MVEPGQPAPTFTLASDGGGEVSLADLRGHPVVLYFYPKDNTSGCTTQARDIRDSWSEFQRRGAVVLGVSPDSVESHDGFKRDNGLPFPLLADPDHAVAERYGVWKLRNRYGKTFMGVERTTVIIGKDGKIKKLWPNVSVDGHVDEVLAALD